jgi:hypothetical protein
MHKNTIPVGFYRIPTDFHIPLFLSQKPAQRVCVCVGLPLLGHTPLHSSLEDTFSLFKRIERIPLPPLGQKLVLFVSTTARLLSPFLLCIFHEKAIKARFFWVITL